MTNEMRRRRGEEGSELRLARQRIDELEVELAGEKRAVVVA